MSASYGQDIVNGLQTGIYSAERVADLIDSLQRGDDHSMRAPLSVGNEMSVRDQFACAALSGLLADPNESGNFADFTERAYGFADAMMIARAVEGGAK